MSRGAEIVVGDKARVAFEYHKVMSSTASSAMPPLLVFGTQCTRQRLWSRLPCMTTIASFAF
jgi:hypothetical protein